jgi:hypothetical protein
MKPALHAALLVAALLGVVVSFGWIVRAGDETCGTVGKEDAFHCSHFAETLGLVGLYGSLLVAAVLSIYAAVRLVAWSTRPPRDAGDSN